MLPSLNKVIVVVVAVARQRNKSRLHGFLVNEHGDLYFFIA